MAVSTADLSANPRAAWFHRWVYYLATSFMFGAATLRALILFQASPVHGQILLLLAAWLAGYVGVVLLAGRRRIFSILLIGVELAATLELVLSTKADFFVFLFAIPCMQVMRYFNSRGTALLVGLTALLTLLSLITLHGILFASGMAAVYFGGTILLVAYIRATRRAQLLEDQQQTLIDDLQRANRQLEDYSRQLEQLAAGRERQRLARDLHDSVTQTLYSMTLATQSALLLLDRDPRQVESQLVRLDELTRSALREMQDLISRLAPERSAEGGLIAFLRQHLEERRRREDLSIRLEIEGSQPLQPTEEAGLFRIAQEALNNIVKHARRSEGILRLHLQELPWMEIEDQGTGFDPRSIRGDGGLGLTSMRERATEIGWKFKVESSPGNGTRIRVEKGSEEGSNRESIGD